MSLRDTLGRPMRNLRLSVTDRCNLRCAYCMPEETYPWLPKRDLLSFEEMVRLVGLFCDLGVDRVRLTGGEPLLRQDLPELVRQLAAEPRIRDLAITTNGVRLGHQAHALRAAGLHRVTVSLDTLRADRFEALTRRDEFDRAIAGIEAADEAGFTGSKLDTVVMRGVNDDEIGDLIEFARKRGWEARFIEYMDVGGATKWRPETVVSREQMLSAVTRSFGRIEPVNETGSAPADRYRLSDGTVFGIISSTTQPFCASCDRSRLTADGQWFRCLYAQEGTDLREPLRARASDEQIREALRAAWSSRVDRGAEERLALHNRGVLASTGELRRNPHLEMHTRGG